MQLLQLSSILQTGGQFSAESPGQFKAESVVSFPRNVVVNISEISTPYSVTLNRTTGAVSVNIPSFTPLGSVAAPAGTTHFKISIAAGDIDFEAETFNADNAETAYIAWNNASAAAIDLSLNVPAASTHPIFVLLALEFVQDVNNVKYTLNNGAFNACAIVKVDTP